MIRTLLGKNKSNSEFLFKNRTRLPKRIFFYGLSSTFFLMLASRYYNTKLDVFFVDSPSNIELITHQYEVRKSFGIASTDYVELYSYYKKQKPETIGTCLILPGITGSSEANYIKTMVKILQKNGFRPVVLNYRGLNGTPIKNNKYLDLTNTDDLRSAIAHVSSQFSEAPLYLVGISMGANLGMRYLGEVKEDTPVKCMVAISNPFDLKATVESLHRDWSKTIYSIFITQKLINNLRANWDSFDQEFLKKKGLDFKRIEKVRTTKEFDQEFTIKLHDEWKSPEEYSDGMSSKNYIEHITKPVFIVNSKNDPISL